MNRHDRRAEAARLRKKDRNMSNPANEFLSPAAAIAAEVSAQTGNINAALAGGMRQFHVPLRLARPIGAALAAQGWNVQYQPSEQEGMSLIVLANPADASTVQN